MQNSAVAPNYCCDTQNGQANSANVLDIINSCLSTPNTTSADKDYFNKNRKRSVFVNGKVNSDGGFAIIVHENGKYFVNHMEVWASLF